MIFKKRESFFGNFLKCESCFIKIDKFSIFDCSFVSYVFDITQIENEILIFDKISIRNTDIGINVWKITHDLSEKAHSNEKKCIRFSDLNLNSLSASKIFFFYHLSLNGLEIIQNNIFFNVSTK